MGTRAGLEAAVHAARTTARLPQELREGKLESLTATRQAPGRTTHKEVVALRVHLGTTRAARRSGGNL